MNVAFLGLCRGNGKIFIKTRISNTVEGGSFRFYSHQDNGESLPCVIYETYRTQLLTEHVVILPLMSINQTLSVNEHDESGEVVSVFSKKISPAYAKWESCLTYRAKPELASSIKNYDSNHKYDRIFLRFWTVVASKTSYIVRGTAVLPEGSKSENFRLRCTNMEGNDLGAKAIVLGINRFSPIDFSSYTVTNVEVSFEIPLSVQDYYFSLEDVSQPSNTGFAVLEKEWLEKLLNKSKATMQSAQGDLRYLDWLHENKTELALIEKQRTARFSERPMFSIVVPLYKTPLSYLKQTVDSIMSQSYSNWELILVNASPESEEIVHTVEEYTASDDRIKEIRLKNNMGISGNTNAGINAVQGDFVCFLDHDDLVEPDILFEYCCAINTRKDTDLIYCDEDKIDDSRYHFDPFFKPDFSIDLLRNFNYVCHMLCIRKSLIDEIGLLDPKCDGAQDHDITLRASEKARHIAHVDKILYHWRASATSTASQASNKEYASTAGITAINNHLNRLNLAADVELSRRPFTYKIHYHVPKDKPLVSIIIPNKDNVDVLRNCIESILEKSTYDNFEILIIENNSTNKNTFEYYQYLEKDARIRVSYYDGPFNFSKIINAGTAEAAGDFYLLLNNDTEVITPEWIERMLGICARKEVGAVGVKLFYPDNTIQHAGLSITPTVAARLHIGLPRDNWGYFALNDAEQNLSAVTAACVMTKKEAFELAGGFTESLQVAFNDIDFCLKLQKQGYLVVYTPEVELFHYESISRGSEDSTEKRLRFEQEIVFMREAWKDYYVCGDPYYNRNLSQTAPGSMYYGLSLE